MNEYIKKDDAIEAVRGLSVLVDDEDFYYFEDRIKALPPADVIERAKCDSCEVRSDSYIEAVSATGYDHGFEDGYSKGRAERKRGEWVKDATSPIAYRCTVCETLQHWSVIQNGKYNFCPNCGADMRPKGDDDV